MILPDTSIWIEFFRQRNPYLPILRHHLEIGNVLALDVVFGELLQGAKNQREAAILENYYTALPHAKADDLFLQAGKFSFTQKAYASGVGLIDLAIIVAARHTGAKIWSRDKKLLSLLRQEEIFHAKK